MLDHPPYSPDLAPCVFFLFPKVKEVIKGVHFPDMEAIMKAVTTELKCILKNPSGVYGGMAEQNEKVR